jgi:integrase
MVLAMTRPFKHPRTGIYWFRKRVPADLVEVVGRKEVTESLGTRDPTEAKQRLAILLREHELRWTNMRAGRRNLTEREAHGIAAVFYDKWLSLHRDNPGCEVLWHPEYYAEMWTFTPLPEEEPRPGKPGKRPYENIIIPAMRRFCLVQADYALEQFGYEKNEWNRFIVGKAHAAALQRADSVLKRMAEGIFDAGDAPPDPRDSLNASITAASTSRSATCASLIETRSDKSSMTDLLERWWNEAKATGRKPSTYQSYRNTIKMFVAFLGHDEARRVTRDDVIRFKDHRLKTPSPKTGKVPSPKTVKDSDLTALKSVFAWAIINGRVPENPASDVTIRLGKPPKLRSKGFTDAEAKAILGAALEHQSLKESPRTSAAKRWVPWLCAFTGARVGEIAQLRKADVTQRDGHWMIRITPEAGTVKTNEAREVVLHPQLVSLGFPEFVTGSADGHLFLTPAVSGNVLGPLQGVTNRLGEFVRTIVRDPAVKPNHGWRHRFKTVGMQAGIPPRILDVIQGHAPRSVADTYGDVTLKTLAAEINKVPAVDLG